MMNKLNLTCLNLFLVAVLVAGPMSFSFAQGRKPTQAKSQTKLAVKEKKNEKNLGFSLSTGLSTSTDVVDERKTRKFTNGLSVSTGYAWEDYNVSASTSYRFISLNNDIVDKKYSIDGLSDTSISIGIMNLFGVSGSIPTSEESQFEGIKGSVGVGAGYQHELPVKTVSLAHSLGYEYVFNTYTHSPISGAATREMSLSYSLGASLDLFSSSSLNFGFGAQTVKLNDGSVEMGSSVNSNVGLGYSYKYENLSMGISYNSGDFLDDKLQNNWFLNQYQQIISLRLGYKWF